MIAADKEKVLVAVRQRLGISIEEAAELTSRAEERFLEVTGRSQIPARAFWLWVDLAISLGRLLSGESTTGITSIKRGDTTIQYGTSSGGSSQSALSLADRVKLWQVVKAR